ncbi:hypothetical protein TIFTF001_005555 [Ficus carica]|uniref:Uncharacterized protein n=1 Tax=Ficus carica TaxID=3494 RepID=A0AA87ZJY3_FICCA|nr:hypothetical protein TIFTF001_005555 [Ficus carica]
MAETTSRPVRKGTLGSKTSLLPFSYLPYTCRRFTTRRRCCLQSPVHRSLRIPGTIPELDVLADSLPSSLTETNP